MERCFGNLIIAGRKTFDEVPRHLQAKVEAFLQERGYDKDGKPLPDAQV